MRRRSRYLRDRRRRTIIGVIVLAAVVALTLAIVESRIIARALTRSALQRAGIPGESLEVSSVGLSGISFANVQLGTAGPMVQSIDVDWTPWGLLHGKLHILKLRGLRLSATIDHSALTLDGLPSIGGSDGSANVPFDGLEISDIIATGKAPAGSVVLSGTLNAARRDSDSFAGDASFNCVVTASGGAVTTLTLAMPDWHAKVGKSPLTFELASGSIAIPADHAALSKIELSIAVTGSAATADLKGELQSTDGSQGIAGKIAINSSVAWPGQAPASTLNLSFDHVTIANDLAELADLNGAIALDSVVPAHTAGQQHLTGSLGIANLMPGPIDFLFRVPAADRLQIDHATVALAGGTVSLDNLMLAADQPIDSAVIVNGVDLAAILSLIGVDGLSGTGTLDGKIPVHLDPAGVSIATGVLRARGSGSLRYVGSALPGAATVPTGNATDTVSLLRAALTDFHYTALSLTLDRTAQGQGSLLAEIKGANPAVLVNYPFALNIRLDADFDRLAALLSSGYATASELLGETARQK